MEIINNAIINNIKPDYGVFINNEYYRAFVGDYLAWGKYSTNDNVPTLPPSTGVQHTIGIKRSTTENGYYVLYLNFYDSNGILVDAPHDWNAAVQQYGMYFNTDTEYIQFEYSDGRFSIRNNSLSPKFYSLGYHNGVENMPISMGFVDPYNNTQPTTPMPPTTTTQPTLGDNVYSLITWDYVLCTQFTSEGKPVIRWIKYNEAIKLPINQITWRIDTYDYNKSNNTSYKVFIRSMWDEHYIISETSPTGSYTIGLVRDDDAFNYSTQFPSHTDIAYYKYFPIGWNEKPPLYKLAESNTLDGQFIFPLATSVFHRVITSNDWLFWGIKGDKDDTNIGYLTVAKRSAARSSFNFTADGYCRWVYFTKDIFNVDIEEISKHPTVIITIP